MEWTSWRTRTQFIVPDRLRSESRRRDKYIFGLRNELEDTCRMAVEVKWSTIS